jgi:hypothetical protein
MSKTAAQAGFATIGDTFPAGLEARMKATCRETTPLSLPRLTQQLSSFDNLKDSPLAEFLREKDPHYKVLCDAYNELARNPKHFTVPMARLRMMCIDRMSCEQIGNADYPQVERSTLWPQLSKAAQDLLESVGLNGSKDDFARLKAQLKNGAFELNFQPWLCWLKQWRDDPCGVAIPPPVSGLIAREVFERLELGGSQQGKGVSGLNRPPRSPDGRNREFTVSPFIKDCFFGVEVRADAASFSDCPAVMPRTRDLVLGYYEGFSHSAASSRIDEQRIPPYTPEQSADRVAVKHLSILDDCRTEQGELLVTGTGALECLRRGIGPFDLHQLQAPRLIKIQERGASIDCFPFARGERHFADTLRLPKERLQTLGITHATFIFEPSDLKALRCGGAMNFTVLGHGPTNDNPDILRPVCPMGRVQATMSNDKLHIAFDPTPALINYESHWYRSEILTPRLEALIETGVGEIPVIQYRQVNRSGGADPKFHILDKDFCLPVTYQARKVFVEGEILRSPDSQPTHFQLSAFSDDTKQNFLARWSTRIGSSDLPRSWQKSTVPAIAPQAQNALHTHTNALHQPSLD